MIHPGTSGPGRQDRPASLHLRSTPTRRAILAGLAGSAALGPAGAQTPARLAVVATFSVLADFVRAVGGDRVDVVSLVPPDGDAHGFTPGAAESRAVAGARLIVENGLGLETWVDRLIGAAAAQAPVVVASRGIKPISRDERAATLDPHAWMAPANARHYSDTIRDALRRLAVPDAKLFNANATAYGAKLEALDGEIRGILEPIPPARRTIVTGHDGFAYFAAAYGFRAITLPALGADAAPGAREIATAVKQVKTLGVPAIFTDGRTSADAAKRVASDAGVGLGGALAADTLTAPGGGASTYLDMMRRNARVLAEALRAT